MGRAGRQAPIPSNQVPYAGGDQRGGDKGVIDDQGVNDSFSHHAGHVQRKDQKGDEIEESRPNHRAVRAQHSRRDDGGHRVGGVVKTVEKVKGQSQGNQDPDAGRQQREVHHAKTNVIEKVHAHVPLMTISEITWETFLQASTVASSRL